MDEPLPLALSPQAGRGNCRRRSLIGEAEARTRLLLDPFCTVHFSFFT